MVHRAFFEYILEGFVRDADMGVLRSSEVLLDTAAGGEYQTAEYSVQSEFGVAATRLLSMLPPELAARYKVLREVRSTVAEKKNLPRLDVLVTNGKLLRIGCELSVRAPQAKYDAHLKRGRAYAKEHKCQVGVVNVVFTKGTFSKQVVLPESDSEVCFFAMCMQACPMRYHINLSTNKSEIPDDSGCSTQNKKNPLSQ